ncbi:radical SAM protein [Vulgatibacter incomptus]|uniref:7-carboxy-7-deazaguanine synthase n=1 Tax=Vulgatibacter incomptus TaxID=1391653 RepID=A0A0K1P941_9BACT|nr:radical SAM protein [Vulgatibacter incomptus]AKU89936.1 Queuosine Biosynthesis QueE Radical SAM [Vulgatibacter incomptus]
MSFAVTEIFFSLQGESTRMGRPCVFIRFTGCDLRCGYCDTAYAFHGGTKRSREEILAEVARHPTRYVTLTGGEPLLQRELPALARDLLERGYEVAIETHGQKRWDSLPEQVIKIVDVKTPASGECATEEHLSWLRTLGPRDELKFVIGSREDFDWSADVVRRLQLEGKHAALLFSPTHGQVELSELAAWILESGLDVRMQIQLHKLIWGTEARGV